QKAQQPWVALAISHRFERLGGGAAQGGPCERLRARVAAFLDKEKARQREQQKQHCHHRKNRLDWKIEDIEQNEPSTNTDIRTKVANTHADTADPAAILLGAHFRQQR